ncbi:MAG: glycosyltransferase [Micrococcales bacterium]|nr:MAG: glycosyltransferase [Micrococcales bacterium]
MGTGGAESFVAEMVRLSDHVGWHCAVASAGGPLADKLESQGRATTYNVPLSRRNLRRLVTSTTATRRVITDFRPEAILAHNVGVSVATGLARAGARPAIPMVSVFHGVAAEDYRNAARVLSRVPDHVVAVSAVIADRLVVAGFKGRPLSVIPNAITAPILMDREQARAELGIDNDVPVALCAARIVPQKRHDVLLDAWAQVKEPALLLIAGDGPDRADRQRQANDLGLGADRVRFLGVRDDVPRLLSACDVTVLASDWEGMPIATLESLAAARPVVATDVDGLTESAQVGGILVPRRNPAALADGLNTLLQDDELRQQMATQGQFDVLHRHDPENMMVAYDRILRSS